MHFFTPFHYQMLDLYKQNQVVFFLLFILLKVQKMICNLLIDELGLSKAATLCRKTIVYMRIWIGKGKGNELVKKKRKSG